jgi:hypothetical protein
MSFEEKPMKRISALIVFVFVFVAVGQEVQHAPTVAQCQADQRLWGHALAHPENLPDFVALEERASEMVDCGRVDPQDQPEYELTAATIYAQIEARMLHYLQRHNMLADFKAEDAAGKR